MEPKARWVSRFAIADHTGSQFVSAFDDSGKVVLGCDAGEVVNLWEQRDSDQQSAWRLEQIFKAAQFRRFRMRLRSKKEVWNDEERVKEEITAATASESPSGPTVVPHAGA